MIEVLFGSRDKENVLQYIFAKEKGYAAQITDFIAQKQAKLSNSLKHWKLVVF